MTPTEFLLDAKAAYAARITYQRAVERHSIEAVRELYHDRVLAARHALAAGIVDRRAVTECEVKER